MFNKVELPVKLEGIEVSNSMINVSASLTNEQLLHTETMRIFAKK